MSGLDHAVMGLLRGVRACRAAFFAAALACGALILIGAPGAKADPAVSETIPITYPGTNLCTGETFVGTGTMHFLTSENLSASGNIEYRLDTSIDGLQAFTVTGKKYVVQDTFDNSMLFTGATVEGFDITAHYVRVGEDGTFILGDDFYERLRTHITANANGQVTAVSVNTDDMPCQ